jgi:hypothetical protein
MLDANCRRLYDRCRLDYFPGGLVMFIVSISPRSAEVLDRGGSGDDTTARLRACEPLSNYHVSM